MTAWVCLPDSPLAFLNIAEGLKMERTLRFLEEWRIKNSISLLLTESASLIHWISAPRIPKEHSLQLEMI